MPPENRIATFDQDGTLWVEHPVYGQAMFALDRVHELAPQHPEWQSHEPFKSVLSNDTAAVSKFTESNWLAIVGATLAGMTEQAFSEIVGHWTETAKHPRFNRLYTELVYQPMLEVMKYHHAARTASVHLHRNGRRTGLPSELMPSASMASRQDRSSGQASPRDTS